ncbi:aminotransferase class V-fold PLP-dependent enzyme [Candidatus Parcubacteria bacterium]|nr:MAG: aminotransferase class V-fold PLP-dependent enzyme [Candidatus Parcubacteria bacterium]
MFKGTLSPGLSPNLQTEDLLNSLRSIISVFHLNRGDYVNKIEAWFKYNFKSNYAFTFSSGREAEYALLSSIGVKEGDEVLVQAFTCTAAINPIIWTGANPVYVDIDKDNYSMNPEDLKKKITKKSKAVIVQHTFGIPGNIEKIKQIAKENNIFLIEDCAHTIGGIYKNKKLGAFSGAAFFSFGRDKAVSSIFGGIVITNKKRIAQRIKKIEDISPYPSPLWTYQQLFHPIATYLAILGFKIYPSLGKLILFIIKKLNLISKPIISTIQSPYEKNVKIKKYPNALAYLCYSQLTRVGQFNKRRLEIYNLYRENLKKYKFYLPKDEHYYLRVPVIVSKNRKELMYFCKKKLVYLGDWYSNVIDPKETNIDKIGYKLGSCKTAEEISKKIINLPTNPTLKDRDVYRIINSIKEFYDKEN